MTSQNRIVRCVASTRYSLSGSANGHALAGAALVAALLMVKLSGDISALLSLALLGGHTQPPCRHLSVLSLLLLCDILPLRENLRSCKKTMPELCNAPSA